MQYSSPQSYCLFMLISYPHGPHKHNMVNHIGHIICILYLYIYIYIILFLVYYYTPYGDINDIILMGYLSILFCSAQEMENEPRREDTAMQDVEVADGRWIGCGYGIWQRLKIRPLYICIYIYAHAVEYHQTMLACLLLNMFSFCQNHICSNIHECISAVWGRFRLSMLSE